jgi:hypothetical protein
VIAHHNWTGYLDGERRTVAFDIKPASGHRLLMDGYSGLIHSADDFGVNDAGIAITETTITGFHGWDSKGIPEFVRARKAMQYSASIADFDRITHAGNNGGYANDWLVADVRTNEIASLEPGLRNVELKRTEDGYFTGANFPISPKLPPPAKQFPADRYDAVSKKTEPSEHTLCGHIDLSPRGMGDWKAKFDPAGAVQNKVTDAAMAQKMAFLAAHPQFAWQAPLLHDMNAQRWTAFQAGK